METIYDRIEKLSLFHDDISPETIRERNIKPGLRNSDGTGVVAGITTKGSVVGYIKEPDSSIASGYRVVPAEGELYYCGYSISSIVESLEKEKRFGYDEIVYLLLTGELPVEKDLAAFSSEIQSHRGLSTEERNILMEEVRSHNQMHALHSFVSHMSRLDEKSESINISDVTHQCIKLIAKLPTVVANNYNIMRFRRGDDLKILRARPELSGSENFLYMLRGTPPDELEAHIFDIAMILHAEHGGGNNSTFTVRVVSSSGANTYVSIAAGVASLSGYLHGGANALVDRMMNEVKSNVKKWDSDSEVRNFIEKIIDGEAGDGSGIIYGLGHAVYTLSDPRTGILKNYAEILAKRNGKTEEFGLYCRVEEIASKLLSERKGKAISANVDYYSGLLYRLLGIPVEIFTPIFAMSRVSGWAAHRIEQILQNKIIRPAYITPDLEKLEYSKIKER